MVILLPRNHRSLILNCEQFTINFHQQVTYGASIRVQQVKPMLTMVWALTDSDSGFSSHQSSFLFVHLGKLQMIAPDLVPLCPIRDCWLQSGSDMNICSRLDSELANRKFLFLSFSTTNSCHCAFQINKNK